MFGYGDPFVALQHELQQMLDGAFGGGPRAGVYPAVDVFDADDEVVVKAELPGVPPDKLEVDVRDDTITLRGERPATELEEGAAFHRRERSRGQFRRVVRLPARLDGSEAKAEYKQGVLTVRVPKAKEVRPRRVPVQAA